MSEEVSEFNDNDGMVKANTDNVKKHALYYNIWHCLNQNTKYSKAIIIAKRCITLAHMHVLYFFT